MQGRTPKRIFAQSLFGDVEYFANIDEAVKVFGHNRAVLYSVITKGTSVKKDGKKWYLDFALDAKSDIYGDD